MGGFTEPPENAYCPIRPVAQEIEPGAAVSCGARIGQIEDRTLISPLDRGVRRVQKALEILGEPVVTARFAAGAVHALLHDAPITAGADDERMQVEVEPVLHRSGVDLRDEAARSCERIAVEARSLADVCELCGRTARMPAAPAANVDAEFSLKRLEPALQRTDYARRDTR